MWGRTAARAAWVIFASCVVLAVVAGLLHSRNGANPASAYTSWWLSNAAAAVALGALGGLIASRRPRNPVGWLLLGSALGHALTGAVREYAIYALSDGRSLPGARWALWLSGWVWMDFGLFVLVYLLFPGGRLRSLRWAPVAAAGLAAWLVAVAGNALIPGSLTPPGAPQVANPVGWAFAGRVLEWIGDQAPTIVLLATLGLGLGSILLHARETEGTARRRTLLVALAGAALLAEYATEQYAPYNGQPAVAATVIVAFAAAVAIAILRYGLYELDLVLNRALVYAGVTVVLGGAYVGTVVLADLAAPGHDVAGAVPAAVVVAMLFAPVRQRLQRAADRLLFGHRRDPYLVIASLGERLDAPEVGAVLPALAETVARTLKLPYVAIELERGGALESAVELGGLRGEPLRLPLVYGGGTVGRLTLGPRTPSDPFTRAERRLFEDIARQVAVAAYAVRLTEDLQRSRERLVAAREEERRRIRRDLHDGLGPTLAGVALQLGSARTLLRRDTGSADELLHRLVEDVQASIADVRRLVYDLRPPALDELGLVPALRQQAQRFPGLEVAVEAPEPIELPAAVEVAAYRIATEALTNVARHAGARTCTIRLCLNGALDVEVVDDGVGVGDGWRPGVGLASLRERAEELGGSCAVGAGPGGGTRVLARLPLPA
jgi:signal transduction histidine kinase